MSAEGVEARTAVAVTEERVGAVADAISRGFIDNEIWAWMVPCERRLARLLPRHYRTMIRHVYMPLGTAWTSPDAAGGALWFPPGKLGRTPLQQARELLSLMPWVGVRGMRRGIAFEELQSRHHPQEPHWYLQTLSIEPAKQRSGYGGALMHPALERADAEGMPCYLETQREANVPYYRRFGFELSDKVSIADSPPLWLMWRAARSG